MFWTRKHLSVLGVLEYKCQSCKQPARHQFLRQRRWLTFYCPIPLPVVTLGTGVMTARCLRCGAQEAVPRYLRKQVLRLFTRR